MKSSLWCSVQYCILRYCGFTVMVCVVSTACRSVYSFHSLQNRVSNSTFSLLAKNARCRETCKQDRRHMPRNRRCTILTQPPAGFVVQYAELVACMAKRCLFGLSGFFWFILPAFILQSFHPILPRTQLQSRLKVTGSQVGRKWLKLAEAAKATPRQPAGAQGCKGWKGAIASSTYGRPSTLHQARTLHPA